MQLNDFIGQKKESWSELENMLAASGRGGLRQLTPAQLNRLGRLYRMAAHDLAFAQTYFPGSEATLYLNNLVGAAHRTVYRKQHRVTHSLKDFFWRGFPNLFRQYRAYFAISLGIFFLFFLLGMLTGLSNEQIGNYILSAEIVEKINNQEMWTDDITAIAPASVISSAIFTNNIAVTFYCFAAGIAAGLGTIYILGMNGFLLGVVTTLCLKNSMGYKFFSFVTGHGILELSIIFLAGAAGLIMGGALLDPGPYMRRDALKIKGRLAVKLILGGVPFLVVAGLIEGYISPNNDIPGSLRIILGIVVGCFFYLYLFMAGRDELKED